MCKEHSTFKSSKQNSLCLQQQEIYWERKESVSTSCSCRKDGAESSAPHACCHPTEDGNWCHVKLIVSLWFSGVLRQLELWKMALRSWMFCSDLTFPWLMPVESFGPVFFFRNTGRNTQGSPGGQLRTTASILLLKFCTKLFRKRDKSWKACSHAGHCLQPFFRHWNMVKNSTDVTKPSESQAEGQCNCGR